MQEVRLPRKPFLYTLDQVALLLDMPEGALKRGYVHFVGRTPGIKKPGVLAARNIAQPDMRPDWRISEEELLRWMRHKGYRFIDEGR